MSSMLGRGAIGALIIATLPTIPVLYLVTRSGWLALAGSLVLLVAVLVGGPFMWPRWNRLDSVALIVPATVTLAVAGSISLTITFLYLCDSDEGHRYLTPLGWWLVLAAFAIPYGAVAGWGFARPERAVWAWPVAILLAIASSIAVMALVEGGAHHCYT